MKTTQWIHINATVLAAGILLAGLGQVQAQGTAFTYQGQLARSGTNATGVYDFTFALFNASSGGAQVGGTITDNSVGVTNGLFTTMLDFGAGVFTGTAYWLQIGVRSNGVGSFSALAPRQELTPTPYAITAENLDGTVSASQLTGTLAASQFPIPLVLSGSTAAPLLESDQTGTGPAISGSVAAGTSTSAGVQGATASTASFANAVYGVVSSVAPGGFSAAVRGQNNGTGGFGIGVYGSQAGSGWGVYGTTLSGIGVLGSSTTGDGVDGQSSSAIGVSGSHGAATGTAAGVQGTTASTDGGANAIYGLVSSTQPGASSAAIRGENRGTNFFGIGVYGTQNGTGWGVYGSTPGGLGVYGFSADGIGVQGESSTNIGVSGMHDSSTGTAAGVQGTTASTAGNANAVYGLVSSTQPGGSSAAIRGENRGTNFFGIGVYGTQNGTGWGVYGSTPGGLGVYGFSADGIGVQGESLTNIGVSGMHDFSTGTAAGVQGTTASTDGGANAIYGVVNSTSPGGFSAAVRGQNNGTSGLGIGVYGSQAGSGWGVYGTTPSGVGVYGFSSSGIGVDGQSSTGTGVYAYSGTGNALTIAGGGVQVSGAGLLTGTAAFVQLCTSTNQTASHRTTIDNPLCNGNPAAILLVTHNYNPPGIGGNLQTHPFSVWFNPANSKWEIYNDDFATMAVGTTFNVLVIRP